MERCREREAVSIEVGKGGVRLGVASYTASASSTVMCQGHLVVQHKSSSREALLWAIQSCGQSDAGKLGSTTQDRISLAGL